MSKSAYIGDIESVLISIADPTGNKAKPKGTADAELRKDLEDIVKKRQEEERSRLFGTKKSSKRKKSKTQTKRPTLKNIFSKARPLSTKFKGKEYKARLLISGKIRYKGKLYDTPSGAAVAALGGSKSGWNYWEVQNEDGNWVKLSTLK